MLQITFLIKLMKIFNCNRNYILKYEKPNLQHDITAVAAADTSQKIW